MKNMDKTTASIKDLRPNGFVMVDGVPCKVDRVDVSKSGKHGAAKARLEAIGLFDGRRRSVVKPGDESVDIPIVLRREAQILSIVGDKVQLMDMVDFSVFELDIPEEQKGKLVAGSEIAYFEVADMKTIKQIK
jgi:translation initiation factor 5A